MTLQQLRYIVAIDQYRHFGKAAEACGLTQSTLSLMVKKLEEELDVLLFNRDAHPVAPTEIGRKVIDQAKVAVYNVDQITHLTRSEKEKLSGPLRIALISTVAPVLIPGLFRHIGQNHPSITLQTEEMLSGTIRDKLRKAEVDMGILAGPVKEADLLEIPLYHESFLAYVSPDAPSYGEESIPRSEVPDHPLWIMRDGVRLFDRSMLREGERFRYDTQYEGGRVGLLIQIINENGGIGIIPETHVGLILRSQQANVRPIVDPVPSRTISLVIRRDFIHERMLNVVIDAVRSVIPARMLEPVIQSGELKI